LGDLLSYRYLVNYNQFSGATNKTLGNISKKARDRSGASTGWTVGSKYSYKAFPATRRTRK